jgi:endoglycosylceramidase
MMMKKTILLLFTGMLVMAGCLSSGKKVPEKNEEKHTLFVTPRGRVFVDADGRQLTLHGINVINKDAGTGYMCALNEEIYRKMNRWGFNVVRLGILWDGLEPQPGQYNEEMFRCIDRNIAWAKKYGMYVVLDMHQDLYSVKYADGAPLWATLDEGKPHHTGSIWSDAYLLSPAIQTAFDNFWKNTPVADGSGVQDHYAALWKKLAERYADEPAVIGYDLMNEPFPGSSAERYIQAMVQAYGTWLAGTTGKIYPAEELVKMWSDPGEKMKVMETLKDTSVYRRILFSILPLTKAFEEGPLNDFYSRVGKAIREVDTNHILFLEHNYFCNPGVPGQLVIPATGKNGEKDRKVAYAPHGYDLLVDTKAYDQASEARVSFLFGQVEKTARRLDIPVLVGEWGAFHSKEPVFTEHARLITRAFMDMGAGETFWAYYDGIEDYPFFRVLQHPYPQAVSGELKSYSFDIDGRLFSVSWKEKEGLSAPSVFYIPGITTGDAVDINLVPEGGGFTLRFLNGEEGAILSVTPMGKDADRELTIHY